MLFKARNKDFTLPDHILSPSTIAKTNRNKRVLFPTHSFA